MKFTIAVAASEDFDKKLAKINKKLAKFDNELVVSRGSVRRIESVTGERILVRDIYVDLSEDKKNVHEGWSFAGVKSVINTTKDGKDKEVVVIVPLIEETKIPKKFYETKICCDHCGVNRYRKNSSILANNEMGYFIEVGNSCVQDFTNDMNMAAIAKILEELSKIKEQKDTEIEGFFSGRYNRSWQVFDAKEILALAVVVYDNCGFTGKNSSGVSNRDRMLNTIDPLNEEDKKKPLRERFQVSEAQQERIDKMHQFFLEYKGNEQTFITAQQLVDSDGVGLNTIPYIAYLPKAYAEHLAKQNKVVSAAYVGEVGKRIKNMLAVVEFKKIIHNDYAPSFQMVKFKDANGSDMVWFNYGDLFEAQAGDCVSIAVTPKKHEISPYTNQHQTIVNRVKLIEIL